MSRTPGNCWGRKGIIQNQSEVMIDLRKGTREGKINSAHNREGEKLDARVMTGDLFP